MAIATSELLENYTTIVRQWLQGKDLTGGQVAEWPLPWLLKIDTQLRWDLYKRFKELGYAVSEVSDKDIIYMLLSRPH